MAVAGGPSMLLVTEAAAPSTGRWSTTPSARAG